jgi:hypothetical protein
VTNAIYNVNNKHDYDQVLVLNKLVAEYQRNPRLSTNDALRLVADCRTQLSQSARPADPYDLVNSGLSILGTRPGMATPATAAKEILTWSKHATDGTAVTLGVPVQPTDYYNGYTYVEQWQQKNWETAFDLAQSNPRARAALNRTFAPFLNAKTTDSAQTILQNNTGLQDHQAIQEIAASLRPDGSIGLTLTQLKDLSKKEFAQIESDVQASRAIINDIDARQRDIVAYMRDEQAQRAAAASAQRAAETRQLKYGAAQSGVYLISTLVALGGDQRTANQISAFGGAAIQIAVSMNKFTDTVAKFGDTGTVFGSAILAGNIVGAIFNVLSVFGSGPTPEQVILDQIHDLRDQVAQLQQDMDARFDRIDHAFNDLFRFLNEAFRGVVDALNQIQQNLDVVRVQVFYLQGNLDRIEQNLSSFITESSRAELINRISDTRNYRARFRRNLSEDEFLNAMRTFFRWATVESIREPQIGPLNQQTNDATIAHELTARAIDANFNYIDAVIRSFGVPSVRPPSTLPLPNRQDWLAASDAYMHLAVEWPDKFSRVSASDISDMMCAGLRLTSAVQNITTLPSPDGQRTANAALFDALTQHYEANLKVLTDGIETITNEYIKTHLSKYDPYVALPQPLTDGAPELPTLTGTTGSTGTLPYPSNFKTLIPDVYRIAAHLGLGSFPETWARFQTYVETSRNVPPNGDPSTVLAVPSVRIEVGFMRAAADGKPTEYATIENRLLKASNEYPLRVASRIGETLQYIQTTDKMIGDNWTLGEKLSEKFVSQSTVWSEAPAAFRKSVDDAINKTFLDARKKIAQDILVAVRTGTLQPAAQNVAAAKALLQSVSLLGATRVLDEDDLLRALLFGNQSLLDGNLIVNEYSKSLDKINADPTEKSRLNLAAVGAERLKAFRDHVRTVLNDIASGKTKSDDRDVSTTLQRLAVFRAVLGSTGPVSCTAQ